MPVLNPGFEEGGDRPEIGRHWSVQSSVRRRAVAGFGDHPARGVESFERWYELRTDISPAEGAFFGAQPEGFEDFEQGWLNDTFVAEWDEAGVAQADWSGTRAEDFERGWNAFPLRDRWESISTTEADFDEEPQESFESGWRDNEDFAWSWGAATTSTARFSGDTAETFEGSWPRATQI